MTEIRKLDTVRALLAKASDPGVTPEEAESYRAKALELAARYSLDDALLAHGKVQRGKPIVKEFFVYPSDTPAHGPGVRAQVRLLTAIAGRLRCHTVEFVDRDGAIIDVFGYPGDVEAAGVLFASLSLQAVAAVLNAEVPAGKDPAAFRRGVMHGFTEHVAERLAPPPAEVTKPGVELVLRDRQDEVIAARNERFPDSVPIRRGRPVVSGEGLAAGRAAGAAADIGTAAAGAGNRGVLQ
ncbi:MAG TPA: DUF2786 domain-containing protein [Streptosporangiaceae bacterium]|nr:DUF2786 domain-containing protein [Streptosporangiaceae bacterium]